MSDEHKRRHRQSKTTEEKGKDTGCNQGWSVTVYHKKSKSMTWTRHGLVMLRLKLVPR